MTQQIIKDADLYINRELSLLSFQWRVLDEARDEANPLLERVWFMSILGSNMEEFFMVRVAGLKRQIESGAPATGPDGLTPRQQLQAIRAEVARLMVAARECLETSLIPGLAEHGISFVDWADLKPKEKDELREYFLNKIFPVLTPLAFDPGHPFPHISNLSLNLAILLRDTKGEERFARLKIPDTLKQLIPIGKESEPTKAPPSKPSKTVTEHVQTSPPKQRFIWLDNLIKANLPALFPGMTILAANPFHIVRDAELEIQEWEAGDLLEMTEEGIRQRRFGDVVRLQVDSDIAASTLEILTNNLEIDASAVYQVRGRVPLSSLKYVSAIDRPDLKFLPFVPAMPTSTGDGTAEEMFSAISRRDILLHHPYDSFQPVLDFLNQAADDDNVLAIKTTLYRIGKNSPVVEALLRASRNGKQVAALVELKARFDEESNIEWAKALEAEGVHVVYGLLGLKCHCKLALVVRKEGDNIVRYVHLGTGNYNPATAHAYTDIGLFTRDDRVASDVSDVFNYLTGYSHKKDYLKLLVAPIDMREHLEALIGKEIEHQRTGGNGRIILKMNALVDERLINVLYKASQAGVQIDLIVRGICCLRPGLPGISENIRVRSIVGRFLEHSRIYYFRNGGKEKVFCGSADMMPRNLDRRVEILFPIEEPRLKQYARDDVLDIQLRDNVKARILQSDGRYSRVSSKNGELLNSQEWFMANSAATKFKG